MKKKKTECSRNVGDYQKVSKDIIVMSEEEERVEQCRRNM